MLKEITVPLKFLFNGKEVFHEVEGFAIAPGLSVTKSYRMLEGNLISKKGYWSIIHNASGLHIVKNVTRTNAIDGATKLTKATDWTQNGDVVKNKMLENADTMTLIRELRQNSKGN